MGGAGGGGEEPAASSAGDSPALVFELLTNDRSRELLTVLYDRGGTVPVDELADRLAASERDVTDTGVPVARHARKRLRHVILPTLADTGLVTYDPETDAVTLADRGERLEPYLACVRALDADDDTTAVDYWTTESGTWR